MTSQPANTYGSLACYGELIAIIVVGGLHIAVEVTVSTSAARVFNAGTAALFLSYVIWRVATTNRIARIWGLEFGNFWPALKLQLVFALPAMAVLVAWGIRSNSFPPPRTFWLALVLYPLWGTAQQFALQNMLVRNLRTSIPSRVARSLTAGLLFGMAHVPLVPIVVLTLLAGVVITYAYERRPNLWAAGIVHGALGAMAYYFVLGRDPGAKIWEFFVG